MKPSRLSLCLCVSVVSLLDSGCVRTHYKSITREPNGIVTERQLDATAVLVKRDLGKVVLGADSLDSSKSDQMAAVKDLVGVLNKLTTP